MLLISLFSVPKHSCNVPLFLNVVNSLYILSCAFCCAHFLECSTYVERVQHDLRIFAAISVYSFLWSLMTISTTFVTESCLCPCL